MINLHVYDHDNHLFMTAYDRPRQAVFRARVSSRAHNGAGPEAEWTRVPDDEGIATIATAMAKYFAGGWLRQTGSPTGPAPGDLQTWVLRPSPDRRGRLEDWFMGSPAQSRYRVMIHRTARKHATGPVPLLWDEVYNQLDTQGSPPLKRRAASLEALRAGVIVLGEGLAAYRASSEAVAAWAGGLGHPYQRIA